MKPADIHRRLAALEDRARVTEDPRLTMTKEERDACVASFPVPRTPDEVNAVLANVEREHEERAGQGLTLDQRRAATLAWIRSAA